MERLTKQLGDKYFYKSMPYQDNFYIAKVVTKLGKLEDIEQELGIPLEVLFKALKQGYIWMWDMDGYYKVSIIKLVCSLEKDDNGEDRYIWEFDIRYIGRPSGVRDSLCGIELKNYNEYSKFYRWWLEEPNEKVSD